MNRITPVYRIRVRGLEFDVDHEIMLITNTRRILRCYQMSLRNKIIIKVDLGTLKVLVEAHGLRVEFVRPNDRKICSRPSQ
jgi:hypothetical protein